MRKNGIKALSLLLALVLVVGMLPGGALAADSDFTIENGVLTKYNGSGGAVTIPDSVTSIGNYAFSHCTGLTQVTIPDSVTSIGAWSFEGCTSLTSVSIPSGVTSIGTWAFMGCTNLTAIQSDIGNSVYTSIDGVLFSKDGKTLEIYPRGKQGTYTIPNSVIGIGDYAFYGCTGLTSVAIPNSVIDIGDDAFYGCTGLTSMTIPNSVTSIGGSAFYVCSGLTSVTIPEGVTSIGHHAFYGCTSLTSVTIPNSVTYIGVYAFCDCKSLSSVTIPDGVTNIGECAFHGCMSLTDVYYSGSKAQWTAIECMYIPAIGTLKSDFRDDLTNVTIHYNSTGPDDVGPVDPDVPEGIDSVYFLNGWNAATRTVKFGDSGLLSPQTYTLAGNVDVSKINSLLNKYVLVTMEQGDSSLKYTITDIQPVESKIGTVSATGEHSLTIDGTTYPVREDFVLASHNGKEILYHISNGTIMGFDVLEERHGVLGSWNETTKKVTIGGTEYSTNQLSDLSFMDNIRNYFQKDVTFLVVNSTNYNPFLKITGLYRPYGNFNADVYHAKWLTQDVTTPTVLNQSTPSEIMSRELTKKGMESATAMWDGLEVFFGMIDDPASTIKKFTFRKKDMYSAVILNALEASMSFDAVDSFVEDYYTQCGNLFSTVSDAMKRQHNIDVTKPGELKKMTPQQKNTLKEETKKWFEDTYPGLTITNSIFEGISMGLDSIGSLEDYGERIASTILLANLNDSTKAVLRKAYQNSLATNNIDLQLALSNCVKIMDSSTEELCLRLAGEELTVLGGKALKYLVQELWKDVTKTVEKGFPEIAILQKVYKTEAFIVDKLTNASSATEQYLKLLAILDVENLMNGVCNDLRQEFLDTEGSEQALNYLCSIRIIFKLRKDDCNSAIGYVDVMSTEDKDIFNDSLFFALKNAFDVDRAQSLEALKKSIQYTQKDYDTSLIRAEQGWIDSLDVDFPGSGLYEMYRRVYDNAEGKSAAKEYKAACPVNVYVYDHQNNVVASVVDGQVSCSVDDVMIALVGDEKVIRLYEGANYRIEYVGYDDGNMDVTITEFDEDENSTRTVNYNDVTLTDGKTYAIKADAETTRTYQLIDKRNNTTVKYDYDSMYTGTKHTVNVVSGTVLHNGEITTQMKAGKGERLQLNAYVPEGYSFVGWKVSNADAVIENGHSQSTTMIMPNADVTVTAILSAFTDVPADSWYNGAVYWAVEQGITAGTGTNPPTFSPERTCTETEILTFLWRANGEPVSTAQLPFTPKNSWAEDALRWAFEKGMVSATFNESTPCTRASTAKFIWQAAGAPSASGSTFTDVPASADYAQAVAWAVAQGITQGTGNGAFSPNKTCTRAEIVTFLYRDWVAKS